MATTNRKLTFTALGFLLYPLIVGGLESLFIKTIPSSGVPSLGAWHAERALSRIFDVPTSNGVQIAILALAVLLAATAFVRARGRDLLALFVLAMSVLFLGVYFYIYFL